MLSLMILSHGYKNYRNLNLFKILRIVG